MMVLAPEVVCLSRRVPLYGAAIEYPLGRLAPLAVNVDTKTACEDDDRSNDS